MIRPHFTSLRTRLLALVLMALTPSLLLMLINAHERRREAVNEIEKDAARLIQRTAGECQRLLDGSRDLLVVMAQTPEVRGFDHQACSELFRRILPQNPQYTNFGMADSNGKLLCSALPFHPGINIGDRGYFRRAKATRGFAVGEYQVGRINGKPAVNVAYPVLDAQGQVKGVVFAALNLDFLNQLSSRLNLPKGADFTIADRRGTIVVRYPQMGKWVGRPYQELPEGRTILERRSGVAELRDADGTMRQYVFSPLTEAEAGMEAEVSVGVPSSVAFARVNEVRVRNALVLAAAAVLTLIAAYIASDTLILRRVRRLVEATRRVSSGDLDVRPHVDRSRDELGRLARSFDEMTRSLQDSQQRLLDAERSRQRFYSEVIRAVTQDKFHLMEPGAVPEPGIPAFSTPLNGAEDYASLRTRLRQSYRDAGMDPGATSNLVQAAGEAVTNALKHARNGRCSVYVTQDAIFVRICDEGPGIRAQDLAATILRPGFSTTISLGMGYTLMLELVDRVWLGTGPDGTVVLLEKKLVPHTGLEPGIIAAMERF